MQHSPDIGVVIPAHDAARHLDGALASVRAQDYPSRDLIVVADTCRDDTAARARRAGVRTLEIDARSPGAARNRGVERLDTEWIAFLDADDRWRPGWLAAVVDAIRQHPGAAVFYGTWVDHTPSGRRLSGVEPVRPAGDVFEALLCDTFIATPAVVLRRDLFTQAGGFDEAMPVSEDYELWLRLAAHHAFHPIYGEQVVVRRVVPSAMRGRTNLEAMTDNGLIALERAFATREVTPALRDRARANVFRMGAERLLAHGMVDAARAQLRQALELQPEDTRLWSMALLSALPTRSRARLLAVRRWLRARRGGER